MGVLDFVKPGVLLGDDVTKVFQYAKNNKFAIPAVNCTSSSTVNAVLETAAKVGSPVIIQFSNGGAAYYAGKYVDNKDQKAAILGAVAGAKHVHAMAKVYGVPVMVHTDHCAKKLLPWVEGCIAAGEQHFKETGEPLFSSHMLDMSEEPHEENVGKAAELLTRLTPMGMTLEMEIGITGGEEDGVDNSNVDASKLYTTPEDIDLVYSTLSKISPRFNIAAAFGNVHGVYKPGNVVLKPSILGDCQAYIKRKHNKEEKNPCFFVFHGGSGSTAEDISEALEHGIVKMNIDTDTQWGYWSGLLNFYKENEAYLQGQIGNPKGPDAPNKKYYDPRVWVRASEQGLIDRLERSFKELNCMNRN
ncbi:fructose-bisphosphate aldolase class 2 [Sphaeroforma arctica JP610]|uniref:fructose-bisphosphate aldolase n=1 Tax=Sphaeroforma arctica JP610 TaxID=667725 RepID=A0A0L0FEH1_9EUKA|nr:fructose-bisphosphate aldolase class 2 [Sphaeroforma arctica JP610]KNC74881.1 fructose-bisphosphate aldolase class 2 [Sphaeroforma arctica JP610]|eukprot:XP_014148783.1 fructose-bisphosphate aldolase class 2 [Sphaeroforma arctica JP610]